MEWSNYFVADKGFEMYKEIFDMLNVWDSHAHIGRDVDGESLSSRQLIKIMNRSYVEKAVIFPFNDPSKKHNFHRPNQIIYNAYKRRPDRLIPFFRLNPRQRWETEFSLRMKQKFKGLKLHPRSQRFDLLNPNVMKIYEKSEQEGLTILIHTGMGLENISDKLNEIAKTFPKLNIILGHAAFVDIKSAVKKLNKHKNIFFDTSTIKIFDLYELLDTLSARKIVYGSDIPYYDMEYSVEVIVHTCLILNISIKKMEKIFHKNLASIVG